jgi:CheY-like chemotaxis protein
VIDDDPNFLEVAERVLAREGYKAVLSSAPETVVQLARQVKPYAVLLDVLMPGLDGWDVIETLKAEVQTKDIPVVMISNLEHREKARLHNANGFIEKPLDSEKLKNAMKKVADYHASLNGKVAG